MSLAPDRTADGTIGLGRLFTSAGVDPYDEVVWERRDARITNWLDGSVAFGYRLCTVGDRRNVVSGGYDPQLSSRAALVTTEAYSTRHIVRPSPNR